MENSNDGRNDASRPPISPLFMAVVVAAACITILAAVAAAGALTTPNRANATLAASLAVLTVAGWGLAASIRVRDHIHHDNGVTRRTVTDGVTRAETVARDILSSQQEHVDTTTKYIDAAEARVTALIKELAEDRYEAGRTEGHLKALRAASGDSTTPRPPRTVNGKPGLFPLRD